MEPTLNIVEAEAGTPKIPLVLRTPIATAASEIINKNGNMITHLGQDAPGGKPNGVELASSGGEVREILPWLKTSASLDPERIETYSVTAYWLRTELKKIDEAEGFLRDGLRANPGQPLLLFELGRIYSEDRQDTNRARSARPRHRPRRRPARQGRKKAAPQRRRRAR